MTCDCRKDIEARLTERFKEGAPGASGHSVELQGYGFAIVGNVLMVKPYMRYTAEAEFPLKKGGTKWKKQTGTMVFSFCPFCGVEIDKQEAAPQGAQEVAVIRNPLITGFVGAQESNAGQQPQGTEGGA
jgi:hypothetical protein